MPTLADYLADLLALMFAPELPKRPMRLRVRCNRY
jgi:hypothetical protein